MLGKKVLIIKILYMDNHNRYCEKCDKWLDNPEDYEEKKLGGDDIGNIWEYKCKTCGSKAVEEQNGKW